MVNEFFLITGYDKEERREITVAVMDQKPTREQYKQITDTWNEMQVTALLITRLKRNKQGTGYIVTKESLWR